ncbi:MAG: transaldolase [Streptomyces sp.]|uniref:transaldolase family protein n=1 Tax=Streptomyces sp. TaxID=1931 RepID=UPI0025D3CEA9|nr:transaldolase family protein [Streptomyces sp.]MBW8794147.1 transaldolase [Streptomyces sp.]
MTTCPRSQRSGVPDQLSAEGVTLWLDDYHRGRLADGSLARLVADGLVGGVISRPAAVARAVSDTTAYRDQLTGLLDAAAPAEDRVYALIAEDARAACTALEPVFRATKGMHGWVSLGISPRLAGNAQAMADHSRRLAEMVDRPNLLIRIPVAGRGLAAAGDVLAHGVGVHLSSVYSVQRYAEAVDVYFRGLERATADGHPASALASLVSLDVGHLNARVDALLDGSADPRAAALRGQAGVAVARLVYRRYEESLGGPHWRSLVAGGARPQRLLWTSENAPESPRAAVHRVERLIAWMTSHALPRQGLEALERHEGFHGDTLSGEHCAACRVLDAYGRAGIAFDSLAHELETAAIESERAAWELLLTVTQTG